MKLLVTLLILVTAMPAAAATFTPPPGQGAPRQAASGSSR